MKYHASLSSPDKRPSLLPAFVAVTLELADASDDLLVRHVRLLRDCVALSQQRWGFAIEAAAVLPHELHLLCAFSDSEFGVREAIRLICSAFDRHVPGREASVWAENTEIIEIRASVVCLRRTFVESEPVRAGLVKRPEDWPYSSAHNGIAQSSDLGAEVA